MDGITTFIPYTIVLPDKDDDGIEDALDTPIANAQNITVETNSNGYTITLTGSDNDNPITYTVITQPTHGELSGTAPNLVYVPVAGYEGVDSFTFFVNDGTHDSLAVTIEIAVAIPIAMHTVKEVYRANETVSINLSGALSGDQDWVGVFHKDADNSWGNVIAWNWVGEGSTVLNENQKDMPVGEYEIRLFFHNEYGADATARAVSEFSVIRDYGEMGDLATGITEYDDGGAEPLVIYHPINWTAHQTPVIYFSPGFSNKVEHEKYAKFFKFIASHGYSVIFVPQYRDPAHDFARFVAAVDAYAGNLDSTRIGAIGHSTGGGMVFNTLELMIAQGYGVEGRFVFPMDAWSPYHMTHAEMQSLHHTNIVMMQFGEKGNVTDARIPLVIYEDLTGAGIDKNYIVLGDVPGDDGTSEGRNEQHIFPYNLKKVDDIWVEIPNYMETRKPLFKPLEALMAYTFLEPLDAHKQVALEGEGKVDPYETGYQKVRAEEYDYGCEIAYNNHIDYCGTPRILPN